MGGSRNRRTRSELPLTGVASGLPGESDADEARWIEADVAGMRVCSVYVPNGRELGSEPFASKLTFLDAMVAHARTHQGAPLVIMGDMNIAPADLDVYDPEAFVGSTHVSEAERSRLGEILATGAGRRVSLTCIPVRWVTPGGTTARATSTAAWGYASTWRWWRPSSPRGSSSAVSIATTARARSPPTTRRFWSSSTIPLEFCGASPTRG